MKKAVPIFLMIFASYITAYAQVMSISVSGESTKFYPVVFQDVNYWRAGATTLEIYRPDVHADGSWKGSLVAKFRYHVIRWGHGSNFVETDIRDNANSFIGGWRDASGSNGSYNFVIWLRGDCSYSVSYPGVSDAPMPLVRETFQEENGPLLSPLDKIQDYVTNQAIAINDKRMIINPGTHGAALTLGNPNTRSGGLTSMEFGLSAYYNGYSYIQGIKSSGTSFGDIVLNREGGNVGIGTTTPQSRLSVEGDIRAKEIKVMTQITVPDYVFDEEYILQPLSETEAYIKLNKHLPEIPSAADVKENGLDLAEMNLLLLKKVEELTLHMIEQGKMLEKLKEKNEHQDVVIAKQQEEIESIKSK